MIGNMWVIPADAKRPNDARTKSPIKPNTESVSEVRRELKKVLKKLYNITERLYINEDDKKSVVLATIAYSLFEFYLGDKETDEMYKIIYKDISGKEKEISLDFSLKEIVAEFIEKFCDAQILIIFYLGRINILIKLLMGIYIVKLNFLLKNT